MKSKVLVIAITICLIAFFSTSMLHAAEKKITRDDALKMIQEYQTKETALQAKIQDIQKVVDGLNADVQDLQGKIDAVSKQLEDCQATLAKMSKYVVKPGDWLSKLAEYDEVYGHGNYRRWKEIYKANKDLIKNPDLILPGWELKIPRP